MPGMIPCSRGTSGSSGLLEICLSVLSGEFCLTMLSHAAVPKSQCQGSTLQAASALQVRSGLM